MVGVLSQPIGNGVTMANDHRRVDAQLVQEVLLDDPGFLREIVERAVQQILEAEMTEHTHATKQTLLYTINQLEAAGYVERVPDPTDGRAKIIRLTQRGWELRRVGDEIIASIEHECVQHLGEERMRQFEALMKDVSSVLEENRAQG